MKRLISFFLTFALLASLSIPVLAFNPENIESDIIPPEPNDYGEPIKESTYYDEDIEATITERTYFVPDAAFTFSDKSGSGWFKNEKTYYGWTGNASTTYYAKGYFTWGDGKSSVSNWSGGYDWLPDNFKVTSEEVTHGTGQYGYVFNNFAYVTYDLLVYSAYGASGKEFSVTIRVSENGNPI